MTYRKRGSARSPEFSPSAMDTFKFKHHHHHKIDQHNNYDDGEEEDDDDDDYTEASRSQSPYEVDEDGDDEEPVIADDDDSYSQSESVNNAPSSPLPKFQNVRDNILFENSPLNSPKFSLPITPTTLNYMNVAPLPNFHGTLGECPMTHLSRFAKVCRANNACSVSTMIKIFPVTLEDEASLWYDLNMEPYSLTWEEIKSSFVEAYYRNDHIVDQFRSELTAINQNGEESVRSYFLRLQLMLKKWPDHGLSDGILRGIFIDGLREDFQDWLIPQRPNSLDEALRLAFDWEQVESIRAARRKKKCGFCEGRHEERDCEVRERMRELWIKSKEKQLDEVDVYLKRCESSGGGDGKKDVGEMVLGQGGKQKSPCQCGKHQCWKKKLQRNNSVL